MSSNHPIFYRGAGSNRLKIFFFLSSLISDSILPNIKRFIAINEKLCYIHIKRKF